MSHRYNLEAFERTMRFLEDCQEKLGGRLVIIMLGDFRQVLPVVRQGTRSDIVQSCINFLSMWIDGTIRRRALTQNMQVKTLLDCFVCNVNTISAQYAHTNHHNHTGSNHTGFRSTSCR